MAVRLTDRHSTLFLEILDDSRLPSRDAYGNVAFEPELDITRPVEAYWRDVLNAESTRQAPLLRRLLESRPWWRLIPDTRHELVTAGFGQWKQADHVAAALVEDGTLAIAYLPGGGTIQGAMDRLHGPVDASWFDPRANAKSSDMPGGIVKPRRAAALRACLAMAALPCVRPSPRPSALTLPPVAEDGDALNGSAFGTLRLPWVRPPSRRAAQVRRGLTIRQQGQT